jgi:acetolactate decarboxylase
VRICEVWHPAEGIDRNRVYRAQFLVYWIVEYWHRVSVWQHVNSEEELQATLLPRAVTEGIDIDKPVPFLLYGHAAHAAGRLFCDDALDHDEEHLNQAAPSRFSIKDESVEIIGLYSSSHRGLLTPPDSHFHMHMRTMDNRISGHLETIQWLQGFSMQLPANDR